jgi:hypothetical protein
MPDVMVLPGCENRHWRKCVDEDSSEGSLAADIRRLHRDSLLESATAAVAFGSLLLLVATLMDTGLAAVLLASLAQVAVKSSLGASAVHHLRYALTGFSGGAFSGAGAMAANYFSRLCFKRSLLSMTQNDVHPYVHHNARSARASSAGFVFQLTAVFLTFVVCASAVFGFIEILKAIA